MENLEKGVEYKLHSHFHLLNHYIRNSWDTGTERGLNTMPQVSGNAAKLP